MDYKKSIERIMNGVKEALGEETIREKGFTQDDFDNLSLIFEEAFNFNPEEYSRAKYWQEKINDGDELNARVIRDCINYLNTYYVDKFDDEFTFDDHESNGLTYFHSKRFNKYITVDPEYKDAKMTKLICFRTDYMDYVYEEQANEFYQKVFDEFFSPCKVFTIPTQSAGNCDYNTSFDEYIHDKRRNSKIAIYFEQEKDKDTFTSKYIDILNSNDIHINTTIVFSLDDLTPIIDCKVRDNAKEKYNRENVKKSFRIFLNTDNTEFDHRDL